MNTLWSDQDAAAFLQQHATEWGETLSTRLYANRLLSGEKSLVLHGGGNTSVKGVVHDILGQPTEAIFVKASGWNLTQINPTSHPALKLAYLKQLRTLTELNDETMVNELRTHLFKADAPTPSIEALLHVFLPHKYIDHTHADAILTLSNQENGEQLLQEALGEDVLILPYVHPGFALAKAVADLYDTAPNSRAMVLMHHGLITWGEEAKESYSTTIQLVSRAETFIAQRQATLATIPSTTTLAVAHQRYLEAAPLLRGKLAIATNNPDHPYDRFILLPVITDALLTLLDADNGKALLLTPPLTTDHLIRTKALPLWLDNLESMDQAFADYQQAYQTMFARHANPTTEETPFDPAPRIILIPGIGAVCAGKTAADAELVKDILVQTIAVKTRIAGMKGHYVGLCEADLFAMEYYPLQRKKLGSLKEPPLARTVALVTGAAGAIGAGICRSLIQQGCYVAAADLPGEPLNSLAEELNRQHPGHLLPVAMDVTSATAVTQGFNTIIATWGGLDLLIPNAGLAYVASLQDMMLEKFQQLQKVNVEGTLLILTEAAKLFKRQGTGGDVVMISTKNVFSPSANFGAYSATKASAHQLARIASLEMADMDVRVNMVAPDGVFADQNRPSGLWAEVGPDRMKARGLDANGLQEYYRNRNLLKARITATHVAKAVLYFATRQTPTTGATIPVDGGLPDATPR